jgi:hypothetical protein
MQIILDSHWFLKDEEAMDWREGFLSTTSIGQRKQSQGRVMKRGKKKNFWKVFLLCYFFGEGEEKDDES